MSHIQEYKILKKGSEVELEYIVNDYLEKGWELGGNLVVLSIRDFYQPMIKLKTKLEFEKGKYID